MTLYFNQVQSSLTNQQRISPAARWRKNRRVVGTPKQGVKHESVNPYFYHMFYRDCRLLQPGRLMDWQALAEANISESTRCFGRQK